MNDERVAQLERLHTALSESARAEIHALLDELRATGSPSLARALHAAALRWPHADPEGRAALLREALTHAWPPAARDELILHLADVHTLVGARLEAGQLLDGLEPARLSPERLNRYALQLGRLERYEEAERAWLTLASRGDVQPSLRAQTWAYVAHTRMKTGRLEAAREAMRAAMADPVERVDLQLLVATIRFDLAIRGRDLTEARAALDDAPAPEQADHVVLMRVNRACLDALEGRWDVGVFGPLRADARADLRLLGATGLLGAAATAGDAQGAAAALLAAERAWAASPVTAPELGWMAADAADAAEAQPLRPRDVARARRWAARAWHKLDPTHADAHRSRLRALGVGLVGPFEIEAPVGHGGTGAVYRARHVSGTPAAVKVLHAPDAVGRALLENELQAVAGLDHPGIACLYDTGLVDEADAASHPALTPGTRWIASELLEGGELTALCGGVSWARARQLLLGILDALAHAHARDLLHLDLKPGNLLLRRDGAPVLVDFGLARGIGAGRPGRLSGTPEYMAPELFDATWADVGPATDLYAAGCTLYELVCGAPPFRGSVHDVRRQHRHGLPPPRPRAPVPEGLEAWLRAATAPSAADRFPTAASAARALVELGDVPHDAGPLEPTSPSEAPTVVLDAVLTSSQPVQRRPLQAHPEPVLPPLWVRSEPAARPELAQASLALFAHRRPPLVGRRLERSLAWSSLVEADRGERVVVAITGPDSSGRRALARWLVERAREVGVAGRVRITCLHEPSLAEIEAAPGALVLVTARAWPIDWPDVVEIALDPLDDEAMRRVLDGALRLTDELARALIDRARGLPGAALAVLRELVALDRLVDGPRGHTLRPGATLPG
jgi:serine/threonine protein kinase